MFVSPVYDTLDTNLPKELMAYSEKPFPPDVQDLPRHFTVKKYLDEYAEDVKKLIRFETRVVDVRMSSTEADEWSVTAENLRTGTKTVDSYDAVVVASGHFDVPYLPDIPGLHDWNDAYPGVISHSKFFDSPRPFRNKKVIVVGSSASGLDIGNQINELSKGKVLASQRTDLYLSPTATDKAYFPEIVEFLPPASHERAVRFADGRVEKDIDAIVFCTGFFYSFPFLSSLDPPVITNGRRVRNTYQHLFYLYNPTLVLPVLPQRIIPFPLSENQAAVFSRVWSGRLSLPSTAEMEPGKLQRLLSSTHASRTAALAGPLFRRTVASGLASESEVAHSPYIESQLSTRRARMDDSQKEEVSLADAMEKYSHIEGCTPREKIRNAYAKLREKNTAEILQNDPSATPSSVGDIEPSVPVAIPETVAPLSVRVDKEPRHHAQPEPASAPEDPLESAEPPQNDVQTIQPSALTVSHAELVSPGSVHLGPSEFAVPLPMDSRVKDDYERVLLNETESFWEYIKNTDLQEVPEHEQGRLLSKMQEVLQHLSNVATHPDLNIAQHITDTAPDPAKEAAWAEYSSAKFLLVKYLVEAATDHDLHLVITVGGEKTQKVVERYLQGKGLAYTRPRHEMGSGTNMEVSMAKGSLSFGIQLSTHNDGVIETYKPPAAIIALDSSLNTKSPSVEHMRTTYARNGNLLPVIWLMVANSSEHIELCPPGPSTFPHLVTVLKHSMRLRNMVGDLQDDALGVHEDAVEIMSALLSDNFNAYWTLPRVEPLHDVSSTELTRDGQSDSSGGNSQPANHASQKRLFVEDPAESVTKRPRIDVSQETSQFTDISKAATQTLDNDLHALEKNLVHMRNTHAAALDKLQKALITTQSRLQEGEKILESLQHRYESQTKEFHRIRRERDGLLESKAASDQKLDKQREDIAKIKDERTQLRHDLEQAREALKNGGGDAAELERVREEVRRLTKENAGLERKAEYERKQAEYTREQYQTASNVAAQSGNENRVLREENERLKRKADSEAVRLRELNMKNDETQHLARAIELEALLVSREDVLRRKEEELREIRKNRPSTRSTSSQPRSPKWTASSRPTSPGFNNNHNSNGTGFAGRGSALRFSSEMSL
ncbi:hypothetical protein AOCH_002553 [Aspergillus ochraceoroseus]|uniref:Uncharacterized protein n=1 Tax=Aspergillus ochraceoroseus TaxID=138278 RepID=A0A0F8U7R2_9EURO|nr:hypothetical protein AOCH_002553 [Aspergillus ochraceoroseus]